MATSRSSTPQRAALRSLRVVAFPACVPGLADGPGGWRGVPRPGRRVHAAVHRGVFADPSGSAAREQPCDRRVHDGVVAADRVPLAVLTARYEFPARRFWRPGPCPPDPSPFASAIGNARSRPLWGLNSGVDSARMCSATGRRGSIFLAATGRSWETGGSGASWPSRRCTSTRSFTSTSPPPWPTSSTPALDEAALGRAGWWRRFRHITLPLIRPGFSPAGRSSSSGRSPSWARRLCSTTTR